MYKELPLLPEQKVINRKSKLVWIFQEKKNYTCHIRLLQQALKHRLILKRWINSKKTYRVIKQVV